MATNSHTTQAPMAGVPFERYDVVRVGLAGTGRRQRSLMNNLLNIDGVEIVAVSDAVPERAEDVRAIVEAAGARPPAVQDFNALLESEQVDVVCIATPWELHVPMAVAALTAGKHAWVEVPAATTVEGCWELVEASERARRHCIMLENCCYGYNELLVLNMVRAGMFGELLQGEAAYFHDLRSSLLSNELSWRRRAHWDRDGNLYPTHGFGPIASYMGINRGDSLNTLVSMSTAQRGLDEWRAEHLPADSPVRRETYRCGDINTSIVSTTRGRTVLLQHNVVSPRPYDRLNVIAGTRGVFKDFPPRIYLEGQDGEEEYAGIDPHRERFEHTLWKKYGESARAFGGHDGMDFIMLQRLVDLMRAGGAPDMDVYDAALWSVLGPLSERSVADGSAPVRIPDFTRGGWEHAAADGFQ